jgi:hypothetical protein
LKRLSNNCSVHTGYTLGTHKMHTFKRLSNTPPSTLLPSKVTSSCAWVRAWVRTRACVRARAQTFVEFEPRLAVECGDDKRVPKREGGSE